MPAQGRRTSQLRGKRLRVEVLLAGAQVPAAPTPLPVQDLVEVDLWDQLPADLPELLALLPRADLYLQDEMQVAFHPTRQPPLVSQGSTWATPGRGSRGQSASVYGFGLVDWRDGWFDGRVAPGRTADV
jgi:hypothetical protein